ncbi:MAG: mechanosensitive ion channel family protein [Fidelibacterota bacterium]|nr:MAG: mechanosensitive ion channel family protein [Candidatus Neomarinimicrobiota bacterium]
MNDIWTGFVEMLTYERMMALIRALVVIVAGYTLAKLACLGVKRLMKNRLGIQRLRILHRSVFIIVFLLFLVSGLRELGFKLGVVLGAAGVLSVALGFAAQTSVSNLISGLFLISEQPFSVGDTIQVGDIIGEVYAIDLLATKIRTFDNLYVRIPNETLVKSNVMTLTKFPQRRVDIRIGVAYKEDIEIVRQILFEVASNNPQYLDDPPPVCNVVGFGDSSINLLFGVWVETADFQALKNSIQVEIKSAFDSKGIEIPFPHITLSPGGAAEPLHFFMAADDTTAPQPSSEGLVS